jgi:GTP-binding protein EngB required for normal cell division
MASAAPLEVLFIGEAVGKSLLIRQLVGSAAASRETTPTVGVSIDKLETPAATFTLREVGSAMRATWPSYYAAAAAVAVSCEEDE